MPPTNIFHKSTNYNLVSTRQLFEIQLEIDKILELRKKLDEGIDKAKYFYFKSY